MFKPVVDKNMSLSEKIVEQIKEMILSGKLKPGEKLPTENELCNMFNVSRTSIREAIKILAGLGFVKIKRGLGIFVEELNASYLINQITPILIQREDDLLDVFSIRKILESQAAAWAAEKATCEDIKRMEKAIQNSEKLVRENIDTVKNLSKANSSFHMLLAKSTGSKVLLKIMQSLLDILIDVRYITIQLPARREKSILGHKEILEAIKKRDTEAARTAMFNHLEEIELVIKKLSKGMLSK